MSAWAVLAVLIPVTVTDIRERRIPNVIILAGLLAGLTIRAWQGTIPAGLVGMLFLGGPAIFTWLVTRGRAIGAGDVKLLAVAGLFLGLPMGMYALTGAGVTVLLFLIGRAVIKHQMQFGLRVPMAPFLLAGTMVALLLGGSRPW